MLLPQKRMRKESPKRVPKSPSRGKNSTKSKGRSSGRRGDVDMADAEEEKMIITTKPYSAHTIRQNNAREAQLKL